MAGTDILDVRRAVCQTCKLALPAILQSLIDWLRPVLFNIFVSRNVKASLMSAPEAALEMDSVGLAIMTVNIVCFATAYGFNGSVDAYAPIAFGEGKTLELHLVLHRQLVFLCFLTAISCSTLSQAEDIFLVLGQSPELSQRAGAALRTLLWSVPGDYLYDCLTRWMKAQQMHAEVSVCAVLGLVVNLGFNALPFDPAHPVLAPIRALVLQNSLLPVMLLIAYVRKGKFWGAPLRAVCSDWMPQFVTGIQSTLWTCAEMWAWEMQVFEASALGAGATASYTLLSNSYSLFIMIPGGFGWSALNALVGEALGQKDTKRALLLMKVALLLSICSVCVYAVPLLAFRHAYAGLIDGGVRGVEAGLTHVLPLIMGMHVLDAIFITLKTWLTLRKHQGFGATMSVVSYYFFGLPLGHYLAFSFGLGLIGLWLGLGAAVSVGTAMSAVRTWTDFRSNM